MLINNAGILRDKTFTKMAPADFELVVKVHLLGSANATKAVWDVMREQAYGRILMTASSSGLFGNFGQANYGAAKLGLAGLAKTLYLEGAKYNVRVNTLAPVAATRMTADIFPEHAFKLFVSEMVVPAALFLVSDGRRAQQRNRRCRGRGRGLSFRRRSSWPHKTAPSKALPPTGAGSATVAAISCRSRASNKAR